MFNKKCAHPKWSAMVKGFQYCTECNEVREVKHEHCRMQIIREQAITRTFIHTGAQKDFIRYILQCSICGKMGKEEF